MKPNKHQIRSQRTRELIIEAAERLFAPHGKAGVSMRTIAKEAGVDLSLLSYHFESKDVLYISVVDRIMKEFADYRNSLLDHLYKNSENPTVFELFNLQIEAWINIAFSESAHRALLIFNQFHKDDDIGRKFWPSDEFVNRFIAALEKALPDADPAFVHWSYHALIGTMAYTLSNRDRIDRISGRNCKPYDREWMRSMLRQQVALTFGLEKR